MFLKNVAVTEDDAKEVVEIVRDATSEPPNGLHFLCLDKLPFESAAFGYVFGEDLEKSQRIVFFQNRMSGHSYSDDFPVFPSPFGLDGSKIFFMAMSFEEIPTRWRLAIDVCCRVTPQQISFRVVAEHGDESRIHVEELTVQRDSVDSVRGAVY